MSEKTQLGLGTETVPDVARASEPSKRIRVGRAGTDAATGDTLFVGSNPGSSAPAVGTATAAEGEPARGDSIGRFVLLGVLGSGGMGLVYSAYDPHLDRKVAIKLLRGAVTSEDARVRLLREAQAMAKINHANVIKVHEVGMYGEQVYVAMEFADAGTVRAWLAHQRRSVAEIVDVFVQAGRGLAAAHAVGLIHRDFKPDNVLMSKDGGVRVTDFGLVSVMHPQDESSSTAENLPVAALEMSLSGSTPLSQNLTRTGSIMGTPTYMTPEQFNGHTTSARTDQFSFCIALYEALYGERPFQGTTFQELAANVTLGKVLPAPKGSTVPSWLRRVLVRGLSLAAIDRFPSMDALLSELVRDRARRRRRILAWSAVAACVAAGGLTFALWPSGGATCRAGGDRVATIWNPARRAQIEAAFVASKRPHAAASFDKLGKLLDDWGRTWELGYVDACEDTRVRGEQSEHLLDLRMQCLTRRLDEAGATIDLLARGGGDVVDHAIDAVLRLPTVASCSDAAALTAAVAPPDPSTRAQVQTIRARLDEARAQDRLGRYALGRDVAVTALAAARATSYRPIVAEALLVLGQLQIELADKAGIETVRESMHVAAEVGDQPGEIDAAAWLVFALTTQSSRYDLALEISELADATAAHAHPRAETLVRLDNSRGLLDATRGKNADARARYEKALAFAEKTLGPDHPAVLTTLNQLGNLLKTEGKFADARKMLERVLATRERIDGKDHPDVAAALNNLGNVYRVEGKFPDAKRLYDRALAIRIAALGPDHPDVGTSYNNLGTFFSDQEDHVSAQSNFEKALAIWEKAYGPNSIEIAGAVMNMGTALEGQGKHDAARAQYERAQKLYEAVKGPDDPLVATVLSNIAVISQGEHKLDEALAMFKRAEQIAIKAYGPEHPDVADYLSNEATVLKAQKKLAEAEVATEHALRVIEKAYGADHPRMAMGLSNLGNVQAARDNYKAALVSYQGSLAIFEAKFGKEHVYVSYSLLGIGSALTELRRPKEAVPYLERALQIRTKAGMDGTLLAETRYSLAQALAASPATRARGVSEAKSALAEYEKAKDSEDATEVKTWLAKQR